MASRHMERRNGRLVPVRTRRASTDSAPEPKQWVIGILSALVLSAIMAGFGIWAIRDAVALEAHGVRGVGVVEYEHGGRYPSITVSYEVGGEPYLVETGQFLEARAGDTIGIIYDSRNPWRMQAADWTDGGGAGDDIFFGWLFIGAAGLTAAAAFVVPLILLRR